MNKHIENIRRTDGSVASYASESELLACSKVLQADIIVTTDTNEPEWHRYSVFQDCDHTNNYLALQYGDHHFNYIKCTKRPCTCVENEPDAESEVPDTNLNYKNDKTANREETKMHRNENKRKEIHNLSKRKLNKHETRLLSKGLKFIQTRKNIDINKLLTDLKLWERRMRLKEFFYDHEDNENNDDEENKPKSKSNRQWIPSEGRNRWLDQYITEVKHDIINGLKRDFKMNVTKAEENGLKSLMHDDSLVIRPADKGSGLVIMDADKYRCDIEQELLGNNTHEEVKDTDVDKIDRKIKRTVNDMHKRGVITKDMKKYLLPANDSRRGRVQANPKIHKKGNPNRVIINGRDTNTESIAECVEKELAPHVKSLPSYIQDTTDFLNKVENIPQPLPDGTIMFFLDVRALYPSVPRAEARIAAEKALNKIENHKIPTKDVLSMMDIVLDSNVFTFNDRTYVQKIGTAIGSKLVMTYACTYMGEWETELPSSY